MKNPNFHPDAIEPICRCAANFCAWVLGTVQYHAWQSGRAQSRADLLRPVTAPDGHTVQPPRTPANALRTPLQSPATVLPPVHESSGKMAWKADAGFPQASPSFAEKLDVRRRQRQEHFERQRQHSRQRDGSRKSSRQKKRVRPATHDTASKQQSTAPETAADPMLEELQTMASDPELHTKEVAAEAAKQQATMLEPRGRQRRGRSRRRPSSRDGFEISHQSWSEAQERSLSPTMVAFGRGDE